MPKQTKRLTKKQKDAGFVSLLRISQVLDTFLTGWCDYPEEEFLRTKEILRDEIAAGAVERALDPDKVLDCLHIRLLLAGKLREVAREYRGLLEARMAGGMGKEN